MPSRHVTFNSLQAMPDLPRSESTQSLLSQTSDYDASASSSSSSSFASTAGYDEDHQPFPSLTLVDVLDMFDAYWNRWTLGIRNQGKILISAADKIIDGSKQIKLPRVRSEKLLSRLDDRDFEKTYKELRDLAAEHARKLSVKWEDQKTVTLREKMSFFFGVMDVLFTALLLGFSPEFIPLFYSVQVGLFLPYRWYTYKQRLYHYFLFDLCYFVNLLCILYLWVFPGSTHLFIACYGLSLGSLGSAIATWRNSLVFHSLDKVISLAIHIFPPLVFTTIRHFYPDAEARYSALKSLPHLNKSQALCINMLYYLVWQVAYYQFVVIARREKIKNGRITSFTYLINDKKRLIGRIASHIPERYREAVFMVGQAVYTLVTLLPPILFLYDSKVASSIYLLLLFSISVWNGASFYMEVYGRRFEKELVKLRQELEERKEDSVQSTSESPVVASE